MGTRRLQSIALLLLASALTVALAAPPQAFAEDLLVSTAISLKGALFDISKKFENAHSGARVVLNGGSSGELAAQIENGAPVDVFVSANDKEMKSLDKRKLLSGEASLFIYNRLVIITPLNHKPITAIEDLKSFDRIAIGNPRTVPAGRYAEQALQSSHLLTDLQKRRALIYALNVRASLTYVEQANVDAGFVYFTDYIASKKVSPAFIVPKYMTDPISYEIARISKSQHAKLADEFIQFASSETSKEILTKYHFEKSWN